MEFVYKIVRRLLRDDDVSFSRNRNYEAYDDPRVRRAARIYRHLQSLEEDLLEADVHGLGLEALRQGEDERVMLKLRFESQGGQRTSFLSPREWGLLLENDRVSGILRRLAEEASVEVRELIEAEILPSP